ncbi:hypothetical protein FNH09_05420 [Streptomyces adustus]|uniref:Uncharacterized protein n=1 Tax=Streptomyces adustus TaxID=1609272 RepID=A0A5N8V6Q0_9ACTN|nr:hypothetical protein [Streptomyces adustus]MPY30769.1 hypothetical protein [Streptomyces adustus]
MSRFGSHLVRGDKMAGLPNEVVCFTVPSEVAHDIWGLPGPGARVAALIAYFEMQEGKRPVIDPSESLPDEHNSAAAQENESDVVAETQPASGSREARPEEQSPKRSSEETVNGEILDGLGTPALETALSTSHSALSGDPTAVIAHEQQAGPEPSVAATEQSTSPAQTMLGGPWLLPVRAVRHVVGLLLHDLLGGEATSRVVSELGAVLKAPRADTANAQKEHALLVAEVFAPFVTTAAHHIHHHLRTNRPHDKHLGLDNSDLVLTITNEDPQVVLVFTQKLANELDHRVKVQLTPQDRLVICPDSPGGS